MSIKALGKQSLIYGIGTILTRLVTFLLLPIYTNVFAPEQYGVVSLAYAFTGFVIVFYRYGMDTALLNFYIVAEGDNKKKYFTTIFSTQTVTSIIFSLVLFALAKILAPVFLGSQSEQLMRFVAIILLLDALRELPLLVLRANEKPKQYILLSLLNVLLLMGLNIYLVVVLKMGIEGVLIGNIIASAIVFIATTPIILRNFSIKALNINALKEVIKFGLPFIPAALFSMVMELSDRYLLEWLADTKAVGIYSAGNNFGKFGLLLVMGFNMGWTPYFLKLKKNTNAKELFARIAKYFLGLTGFFLIIVTVWIDSIVRLNIGGVYFFGQEYWSSTQVVPIILLGYYFFGFYVLQLPGVFFTERTKFVPVFRIVGASLIIIFSILFIPKFGIMGAAYSKALAYLGMSLAILFNNNKYFKIPHFWKGLLYPILFLVIIQVIPKNTINGISIIIFYLIFWYIFVADKVDKLKLRTVFK